MVNFFTFPRERRIVGNQPWLETALDRTLRRFGTHPCHDAPDVALFRPTGELVFAKLTQPRNNGRWMVNFFRFLVDGLTVSDLPEGPVRRCVAQRDKRGYQCGAVQVTITPTPAKNSLHTVFYFEFRDLLTGHYLCFAWPVGPSNPTELFFGIGKCNLVTTAIQYFCLVPGKHPAAKQPGLYVSGQEIRIPDYATTVSPHDNIDAATVTNLWDRATALIDNSSLYTATTRTRTTRSKK